VHAYKASSGKQGKRKNGAHSNQKHNCKKILVFVIISKLAKYDYELIALFRKEEKRKKTDLLWLYQLCLDAIDKRKVLTDFSECLVKCVCWNHNL
jgi:hypothetical protein